MYKGDNNMANECFFFITAKGNLSDINTLQKILSYKHNTFCFSRVRDVEIQHISKMESDKIKCVFSGVCAHAAYVSMLMDREESKRHEFIEGKKLKLITLEELTNALNFRVEIESIEYGVNFEEKIIVDNGVILLNEYYSFEVDENGEKID